MANVASPASSLGGSTWVLSPVPKRTTGNVPLHFGNQPRAPPAVATGAAPAGAAAPAVDTGAAELIEESQEPPQALYSLVDDDDDEHRPASQAGKYETGPDKQEDSQVSQVCSWDCVETPKTSKPSTVSSLSSWGSSGQPIKTTVEFLTTKVDESIQVQKEILTELRLLRADLQKRRRLADEE